MKKLRGKVEQHSNSVSRVQRGVWYHAFEKLREAESGLAVMTVSNNQVAYEQGWSKTIDALEQFWNRFFEEGAQLFPSFTSWLAPYIAERKRDPLLVYFIQARHLNQHGNLFLDWGQPTIQIGPDFHGLIGKVEVFDDGSFQAEAETRNPNKPFRVFHKSGEPRLPTVYNRKTKKAYAPPSEHMGNQVSSKDPLAVSKLALRYYKKLLQTGQKRFA